MAIITIDGKKYETDEFSDDAKRLVTNILFCDRKLEELKTQAVVLQTARQRFVESLTQYVATEEKEITES